MQARTPTRERAKLKHISLLTPHSSLHIQKIIKNIINMILNRAMECMDRESMRKLQTERLVKTVKTCYEKVPFYRRKMD